MKILALEPFYAGSHKSFIDGWQSHSKHDWTIVGLPGYKWKWRMRHAPVTFAKDIKERLCQRDCWDILFTSDMLALQELLGLIPELAKLPSIFYFHENQLTYPERDESQRDFHYAFTNIVSASIANEVWFNSEFHREDFLTAAKSYLERMPDYAPHELIDVIREKSAIQYPGIEPPNTEHQPKHKNSQPLHILWAARWEFDKNPETFFAALQLLRSQGKEFQLSVIGEQFKNSPSVFKEIEFEFANELIQFGFLESRDAYLKVLSEADIFVTSAIHEFFGIGCVEAISQGCYPLAPKRLAYPETVGLIEQQYPDEFFYDGTAEQLAKKLSRLIDLHQQAASLFENNPNRGVEAMQIFSWKQRAKEMDDRIDTLA